MKGVRTIVAGRLRGLSLLSGLILLGCSTTTVIRPGQNLFLEERGVLVTRDGRNIQVQHTLVRNDSILATDSREGVKIRMPMAEAEKLLTRNRVLAAWQGALLFAGAGAVLGAIPDPDCGDPCLFPNGGLVGSIFVATFAAPVGALVGAVQGRRRKFLFEPPSPVAP